MSVASERELSRHLVAFVDLLGFRAAVAQPATRDQILNLLLDLSQLSGEGSIERVALEDLNQILDKLRSPDRPKGMPNYVSSENGRHTFARPAISAFSDTVVVSFKIDPSGKNGLTLDEGLHFMYFTAGHLAGKAFDAGLLIRGGLTAGDLYHQDGVLMGPALIEAYELEQGVAGYPRLVCSKVLSDDESIKQGTRGFTCYLDTDGLLCLDYLSEVIMRQVDHEARYRRMQDVARQNAESFGKQGDLRRLSKWQYFSHDLDNAMSRLANKYGRRPRPRST